MAQRSCCGIGACQTGCAAPVVQKAVVIDYSHKHSYCHTHNSEKNRTRKVTKSVQKMVAMTKVVLKPVTKTVSQTVMKPTMQMSSRIVNVPKTITEQRQEFKDVTVDVQKTRMVK